MTCQFKFKNGTLCGTKSYNAIYCEGHLVIVLQDRIAELEAACARREDFIDSIDQWEAWLKFDEERTELFKATEDRSNVWGLGYKSQFVNRRIVELLLSTHHRDAI